MYSDVFCKVYDAFGWNYYPEAFAQQLLLWLADRQIRVRRCLDLGCGTGILCGKLQTVSEEVWGMDLSEGMIRIARENDPHSHYEVGDMVTYRPELPFDLVTCTGDALNHIASMDAVGQIFENVYGYLEPGGYFVFDILDEKEVSDSEPFEMDFSERTKVWFQMTCPKPKSVKLHIRVYESDVLQFEEEIRETVHDPEEICRMLRTRGFSVERCGHRLCDRQESQATTWFVIARKPEE